MNHSPMVYRRLVALTGARGFWGGHTAEALCRAVHRARALVRSSGQCNDTADEWRVGDQYDPQEHFQALHDLAAALPYANSL